MQRIVVLFPEPFGPEKAGDGSRADVEAEVIDCCRSSEPLREIERR